MDQFIKILGQVGIDVYLLIAQIVNFGILLFILKKFIYKPIVDKIENDEKELEEAKDLQDQLAQDKEAFAAQKKSELAKAKKSTRSKIVEAEKVAEDIKTQAKTEAEKEVNTMITQMKKQLKSRQTSLKNELLTTTKKQIFNNVIETAKKIVGASPSAGQEFQKYFTRNIPQDIDNFPPETFKEDNPSVTLETAYPLEESQKSQLEQALSKKFSKEVKITEKTTPDLISGYRLEINGREIENNLFVELANATETSE